MGLGGDGEGVQFELVPRRGQWGGGDQQERFLWETVRSW